MNGEATIVESQPPDAATDPNGEERVDSLIERLTFVLPAYNEAGSLEQLLPRVLAQQSLAKELQVLVIDDHSTDETFEIVRKWSKRDSRVSGIRLARNCGSHMAILSGLSIARGDAVVVLASDGQDPPEFTGELIRAWKKGAQIVWAVRSTREGESFTTKVFSRLYYAAMNRWSFIRLPPSGADFFLLDRMVVDAVAEMPERNTSVLALITWLGFRQVELPYTKLARIEGRTDGGRDVRRPEGGRRHAQVFRHLLAALGHLAEVWSQRRLFRQAGLHQLAQFRGHRVQLRRLVRDAVHL